MKINIYEKEYFLQQEGGIELQVKNIISRHVQLHHVHTES